MSDKNPNHALMTHLSSSIIKYTRPIIKKNLGLKNSIHTFFLISKSFSITRFSFFILNQERNLNLIEEKNENMFAPDENTNTELRTKWTQDFNRSVIQSVALAQSPFFGPK